jgi:aryl-alcohol dehydrogenase-like predicted oxidoreductase
MTRTSATADGTRRYADRMIAAGAAVPGHFHTSRGLALSSIGLGTYLGEPDDSTDLLYVEAVDEAIRLGCNVVDSAVNYRFQRSERAVGVAFARCFESGAARRDEIVVTTKGGYVPFDGDRPRSAAEMQSYLETTFFKPGICTPSDMVSRGQHCMTPRYLAHQLDQSLANLGLDSVDVYYIHNPEGQIPEVGREEFERRILAAFELLEAKASEGKLGCYGTATWSGYRGQPHAADYLSLGRLEALARQVGGPDHRFRAVQLPYNLAMPEAFAFANQEQDDDLVPLVEVAADLGISVFGSATLMQSRLAGSAPAEIAAALGFGDGASCAIQFSRSTPGVASALIGMKRVAHVRANLALAKVEPGSPESIEGLFEEE